MSSLSTSVIYLIRQKLEWKLFDKVQFFDLLKTYYIKTNKNFNKKIKIEKIIKNYL